MAEVGASARHPVARPLFPGPTGERFMIAGIGGLRPCMRRIAVCLAACALAVLPGLSEKSGRPPSRAAAEVGAIQAGRESGARNGYLIDLAAANGGVFLLGAAEIDNYLENKHLAAEDDWLLALLNDRGESIGTKRIRNPGRLSPIVAHDQELPFTVKVPAIEGLAAVAVYDQDLVERLRIPIDSRFRDWAAANRREFLAFDRENRRLLGEARAGSRTGAARRPGGETMHFETFPEDMRRQISREIALELAALAESGMQPAGRAAAEFEPGVQYSVSGRVYGQGQAPLAGAYLLLRQLSPATTAARNWTARSDGNGRYSFLVPGDLVPSSFVLSAYASSYVLQSVGLEIRGDTSYDFQLLGGNEISGIVKDASGNPLRGARVRAFASGMFVNSGLTSSDGRYSFRVPEGVYEIEALPPANTNLAPAAMKNVAVAAPYAADFQLPRAEGVLAVTLRFPSEAVHGRFASKSLVRFELHRWGMTVYAGSGMTGASGYDEATGKYYRSYFLYLRNGSYSLTAYLAGCRPIAAGTVHVDSEAAVALDVPQPFLWTGRLVGADGAPLAGMSVQSYTDLAREYEATTTDAQGRFSILYTPGGFVKFFSDPGSRNILHTERIGAVTADRYEDVVLDAFPPFEDTGTPLTQMYGTPDRENRWNIVMIGDGYTGISESYTDVNGNGRWDGVLYYDLNQNGLWDTGEPYQRYGTASAPVNGTDPRIKNEPFVDLNGDGVPNLRDQELFDQNTLDTARSLFGQDLWRHHREAFNIFRIRLVSRQAGHDVRDAGGTAVIQRDTVLGTYLDTPSRGYLFHANTTLVSQYINQYVPECDTRIVLVNQPIRMGRVSSYVFQYGGDVPTLCNDYVIAHEMGHNIGLLADEYTEYQETYAGNESASRNITALRDPETIPWKAFITPGKEIPSCPGSGGVGLFEGAGYYTGGRYRPTEYCMMVSGNRYCPVCTNEIEIRLAEIGAAVPDVAALGPAGAVSGLYPRFEWQGIPGVSHALVEIESADGSRLVASYDVYGDSLVLPFPLAENREYRWRVRPASAGRWGNWSPWTYFTPVVAAPAFLAFFPQIVAGGDYETVLTGINAGATASGVDVALLGRDGRPFAGLPAAPYNPAHFSIPSMGTFRLPLRLAGGVEVGYARIASDGAVGGNALFRLLRGARVRCEAGVGLSRATRRCVICVDNTRNAAGGYALVNGSSAASELQMILRDAGGKVVGGAGLTLAPGEHLSEFAFERFPGAAPFGFLGTLEVISSREIAALALRYDNLHLPESEHVFSSAPVLVDEMSTELYFPQVADGGGFRTDLVLINPQDVATSTRLDFYRSDGTPMSLPVGGTEYASMDLHLDARGTISLVTDGTAAGVRVGWARVTCPNPIFGCAVFQTRDGTRILSEAAVASSPAATRFLTYADSKGAAGSGVAICNPNAEPVSLTLCLRRSDGRIAAGTFLMLPPAGHTARFFTEWFPYGFDEFEGSLEVVAGRPVSAVALRFDNRGGDVFASLPVVIPR